MLTTLTLASALLFAPATDTGASPAVCVEAGPTRVVENFRDLYQSGVGYDEFLGAANRRKELWHGNSAKAEGIDIATVERARAVGGVWRLLAVAIDSCSDSVSTIPYLAELAARVDGLELRVVDPTAGRSIMEAHRTPDGRAATPTVLLLDADYEEAGCFIERPMSLQDWMLANNGKIERSQLVEQKMEWYAEDAGAETVAEIVSIIEAAAAGNPVCGR